MGLYDSVLFLDEVAACPHGHRMRSFQTKDLDAAMSTYVVHENRLYLAAAGRWLRDDDPSEWRIEGHTAIEQHRYALTEVIRRSPLRVYSQCRECEPILVRTDFASAFGDIVHEHALFVDFRLTFRYGEPVMVERTAGTREDMRAELRSRGLFVLADDEPLAVAHHELKRARRAMLASRAVVDGARDALEDLTDLW